MNLNLAHRAQNGSNGTNGQHVNGNGALASAELLRSETASGNPVQVVGQLSFPLSTCRCIILDFASKSPLQ